MCLNVSGLLPILFLTPHTRQENHQSDGDLLPVTYTVFTDIAVDQPTRPADKLPQFVLMFNGAANHAHALNGSSELTTVLNDRDEIIWKVGNG